MDDLVARHHISPVEVWALRSEARSRAVHDHARLSGSGGIGDRYDDILRASAVVASPVKEARQLSPRSWDWRGGVPNPFRTSRGSVRGVLYGRHDGIVSSEEIAGHRRDAGQRAALLGGGETDPDGAEGIDDERVPYILRSRDDLFGSRRDNFRSPHVDGNSGNDLRSVCVRAILPPPRWVYSMLGGVILIRRFWNRVVCLTHHCVQSAFSGESAALSADRLDAEAVSLLIAARDIGSWTVGDLKAEIGAFGY